MSLRERVAQLLMVRLGSNVPPPVGAESDADRVRELVDACPVGGLIVFRGAWPGVREALQSLQATSDEPLLVGADLERGAGQQVKGATVFPHAMAAGACPDPEEAAATLARATAREARAAGIHLAFAPVADVDLERGNPIIGPRAFSGDPERAGRCVEAYVAAAREEGLLTCAKHFPGHGRTVADSHATLPVVDASRSVLQADLHPFHRAVEAGVDSIMTAHVAYPALDPSGAPATASRSILTDLLRDELGFEGCVVSDSLLMEGIRGAQEPGTRAAALIAAGVDLLLDVQDPVAVLRGVVDAVRSGHLPEERIDEAAGRVAALKERVAQTWTHGFGPVPDGVVGSGAPREQASEMARSAVTVRGGGRSLSERISASAELLVVRLSSREADAPAPLGSFVQEAFPRSTYVELNPASDSGAIHRVRRLAREAPRVVCAIASEPAAWHDFGLPDSLRDLAADVLSGHTAPSRPQTIAATLGSPHVLHASDVPDGVVVVDLYSDVPASQEALVRVLKGG